MTKDSLVALLKLVTDLCPETLLKKLHLDITKIIKNKKNCLLTAGLWFL